MEIYLMRHGETYWNRDGLIQGSSDIALTEYGEELAGLTAEGFARDGISFSRIYTSPLIRAVRTAEIIAQKTLDPKAAQGPITDERLREMCFGKYEGQSLRECRKSDPNIGYCFSEPERYEPDETGERFEDVSARIGDFMDSELLPLESVPGMENVLVICHGAAIRTFLMRIDGTPLSDFWKTKQPNCSVNEIRLKDGVFTVIRERILYYESEELSNRGIL